MRRVPADAFLDKARSLSREEAEQIFSRMRNRLRRRLEDKEATPLQAVAMQLQKEDEDLDEWRQQWGKIIAREDKKTNKK